MVQHRSYQIILAFTLLSFVGIALISQLSLQLNPTESVGSIVVRFSLPNTSPEVLEQQLTSKIEGALSTIQGVKKISSQSMYNYGYVTLELEKRINVDQVRFEVAMLVRQLYPKLPKEAGYPVIQLNSNEGIEKQESFMTMQLSGNGQSEELSRYVEEKLNPKLASVKGIYKIESYGGNRLEWIVSYDKQLLDALNINEKAIVDRIEQTFKQQGIGLSKNADGQLIRVVLNNQNRDEERWKIPIGKQNNRIIYLTDVAKVYQQARPVSQFYRVNGKNTLNIVITADKGVNQIQLSSQIRGKLSEIRNALPQSYQLVIEEDSSQYIIESLEKIGIQACLALLILLGFIWITIRKWWYLTLISISLVINLALSFILFYIFEIEIHLYSLAALTTSLGIIIDNTIVMIEHYQRCRNLKVFISLLGATFTTIAGLVVIFFLPEENRVALTDFALVMLITLLVSLPVSVLFIPSVMERIRKNVVLQTRNKVRVLRFKVKISQFYLKIILFLKKYQKTTYLIGILVFGIPYFLLPDKIAQPFFAVNIYNKCIGNEWYQENAKPVLNKCLGGTLRLFVQYVYQSSYFQSTERTVLNIYAGLPNNSTIEQINDVFRELEDKAGEFKDIDKYVTNIYDAQNGTMRIYFTTKAEENGFPYRLKNMMVQLSAQMSGIEWNISGVGQGFNQSLNETETPTFNVKMVGYNYDELERQALKLKEILEKHPRIQEVNINTSMYWYNRKLLHEYLLKSDDRILSIRKVPKKQMTDLLTQLSAQPSPDLYSFVNNEYIPVKITPLESQKMSLWNIENMALKLDSSIVKLSGFSKIVKEKIMPEILKENQQYLRRISFTYFGSNVFGEKFLEKTLSEFNRTTPIGYKAEKQSYNWLPEGKETQYWLIGLVIILIYIICAIIFESLLQPFALILIIPLSYIGVFLTFYWFDFNFDQGGYASFILLSGNVVCAAIFIINEYNILREKCPFSSDLSLYIKAFNHKLIPILSTVLSTVIGLIPFLIYGEKEPFWFAFGVGTIGGLLMSLIVIPIFLPLFLKMKN